MFEPIRVYEESAVLHNDYSKSGCIDNTEL